MKWIELSVQAHSEAVDAIAEVFRAQGTGGVSIEQTVLSEGDGGTPAVLTGLPIIKAYLPATPQATEQEQKIREALWHLQAFDLSPVGPLESREVDEEDWAEGWKQHFHPLKVGRVVIKPSWRTWEPSADEIVVELDPGMAFGTGLHPTTRLVLRALQELIRPEMNVLDVGSGSGILALAAAKLGARVTATDISEVAVEVARQNVEANGLQGRIQVMQGSLEPAEGRQFQLVLANIIASVLIDLAVPLRNALEPGCVLLASGIIEDRAVAVREVFEQQGMTCVSEEHEDDWWLYVLRRDA